MQRRFAALLITVFLALPIFGQPLRDDDSPRHEPVIKRIVRIIMHLLPGTNDDSQLSPPKP